MSMVSTCGFRSMTASEVDVLGVSREQPKALDEEIGFEAERLGNRPTTTPMSISGMPTARQRASSGSAMRSRRRSVSRNRPLVAAARVRGDATRTNTVGAPEGFNTEVWRSTEFHAAEANLLVVDVQRVRIRVRARRRAMGSDVRIPRLAEEGVQRVALNDASGVEELQRGARHPDSRQPPRDARRRAHTRVTTSREPRTRRTSPTRAEVLRQAPADCIETPRMGKDVLGSEDSRHRGRLARPIFVVALPPTAGGYEAVLR